MVPLDLRVPSLGLERRFCGGYSCIDDELEDVELSCLVTVVALVSGDVVFSSVLIPEMVAGGGCVWEDIFVRDALYSRVRVLGRFHGTHRCK